LVAAWLDHTDGPTVMVVSGPAGVGKTRFVAECGLDAREQGWVVGWLVHGVDDRVVELVGAAGEPTLVLVDDADTRTDLAVMVEQAAAAADDRLVRVLLIARDSDGLGKTLERRLSDRARALVGAAARLRLLPIGDEASRGRWFTQAFRIYANALGIATTDVTADNAAWLAANESLTVLHSRALAAALARERSASRWSGTLREVADELLAHEAHWWEGRAAHPDHRVNQLRRAERERALLALTLLGADSMDQAITVLRRLPEFATNTDASDRSLRNLADWARGLYPAEGYAPRMRPNLLVAWFVVSRLTGDPDLTAALLTRLDPGLGRRVLKLLVRAASDFAEAVRLFGIAVGGDTDDMTDLAVDALIAKRTDTVALDRELANTLQTNGIRPHRILPALNVVRSAFLPHTRSVLAGLLVDQARRWEPIVLATALNELGDCLRWLRRFGEALPYDEEASVLWRELATDNPSSERLRRGLAASLTGLGLCLGQLDRPLDALPIHEEAIGLRRELAAEHLSTRRADLAYALINHGTLVWSVGRSSEALRLFEEAIEYLREQPASQPDHSRDGLAMALMNASNCLRDLGRPDEALPRHEEALGLWREMYASNPARYRPGFCDMLSNLGACLVSLDRHSDAVRVLREAVELLQELNADHEVYRRLRARTLANLAASLINTGYISEAQPHLEGALGLLRVLVAETPIQDQPMLALVLHNLAVVLRRQGRLDEAMRRCDEAVGLLRGLDGDNPEQHRTDLAGALMEYGACLWILGTTSEARPYYDEAVGLLRRLDAENPDQHRSTLAHALVRLGNHLLGSGHVDEGLAFRHEAVGLWRSLAVQHPDLYETQYRHELAKLHREYADAGRVTDSFSLDLARSTEDPDIPSPGIPADRSAKVDES
jgi:tetratricopeptide (TPR) repeat protein